MRAYMNSIRALFYLASLGQLVSSRLTLSLTCTGTCCWPTWTLSRLCTTCPPWVSRSPSPWCAWRSRRQSQPTCPPSRAKGRSTSCFGITWTSLKQNTVYAHVFRKYQKSKQSFQKNKKYLPYPVGDNLCQNKSQGCMIQFFGSKLIGSGTGSKPSLLMKWKTLQFW